MPGNVSLSSFRAYFSLTQANTTCSPRHAEYVIHISRWLLMHDFNRECSVDYAINNKLTPFISMQNHYNLVYREEEREMFPTLKVSRSLHLSGCELLKNNL
jgi:hypothetical protein